MSAVGLKVDKKDGLWKGKVSYLLQGLVSWVPPRRGTLRANLAGCRETLMRLFPQGPESKFVDIAGEVYLASPGVSSPDREATGRVLPAGAQSVAD